MIKIKRHYRCVFCGGKKSLTDSYYNNGHIGICGDCFNSIHFTPKPPLFRGTQNIDYLVSPIFYSDTIRDIIIAYKFNGQRAYSDILSYILCDLLKDMQHLCEFDCVIPVPLSKKRMNERGFNQSALLAKPLADCLGVPYRDDILFRIRETKRQSRIKISERTANVQNAFEAAEDLRDKRILLVDDIFTTGNTMNACAEALKQRGAKNIVGIALTMREKHENIFNLTY